MVMAGVTVVDGTLIIATIDVDCRHNYPGNGGGTVMNDDVPMTTTTTKQTVKANSATTISYHLSINNNKTYNKLLFLFHQISKVAH